MKADPYELKTVFGFEKQLFAPLFQRPYVWNEKDQWAPLWADVRRVAEELLAGNHECKPHFLGAVVLDQIKVPIGKPDARSIIDGQQRLTTLQLMMEAVRDLCRGRDNLTLQKKRMEKLIENEDVSHPDDRFKVWPTNVDRPVYRAILETNCPETLKARIKEVCPEKRSRLADAYAYFYYAIREWLDLDNANGDGVAKCDAIVNTIREKLRLVVIDMDDQDDAQMIFETLNARGTPLLPSDLVKNFLFRRAQDSKENVDELHAKYWESFDVEDSFWREEIGVGRVKRARIDVYLQHYLSFQKRDEVTLGELFKEYQEFAENNADRNIEWQLESFHRHAQHFKQFFQRSEDGRVGIFFERLARMQTMTVFPFLLGLFDSVSNDEDRIPMLIDIESYLVRRMVCRLTTKGYNRFFLDLVAELSGNGSYTREEMRVFLLRQTADSVRWPDDTEFKNAWLHQPLYTGITRPRLRLILYALDSALKTKNTESYTLKRGLTVEHFLPQHWQQHWPLEPIANEEPNERAKREQRRGQLLHTIGNLTMLTSSLNPMVSNGAFEDKKKAILKHSAINLNRFVADEDEWDEDRITQRGERLFELATAIWPHPANASQSLG